MLSTKRVKNKRPITKQKANKILDKKLDHIRTLIKDCEKYAIEHDISLSSPFYDVKGMGGHFNLYAKEWMPSAYDEC